MFLRRRQPDIDRGQNREHVCLHHRNENMQRDKGNGNERGKNAQSQANQRMLSPTPQSRSREQAKEESIDQVASKNVGPQTHRQRKQSRAGADDFHGKDQRNQGPAKTAGKRLYIAQRPVMTNALPVEIDERDRSAERRV